VSTPEERLQRRRRRRNPLVRPLAILAAGLVLLVLGIAIGQALEDGPSPGGVQTGVRTLQPRPLPPAATTVTITVQKG
jgi:hypothetical protein